MGRMAFLETGVGKTPEEVFSKRLCELVELGFEAPYSGTLVDKAGAVPLLVVIDDPPEAVLERVQASGDCPAVEDVSGNRLALRESVMESLRSPHSRVRRLGVCRALLLIDDARIADRWGPCGACEISPGEWCLFGWAPV